MNTFEHGGDIHNFAKSINCKVEEIIDLSSNINFIKPEINCDFNTLSISSYPKYEELYRSIANNYNVKDFELELYNGGSSAIFTLFRHLNLNHCTIYSPAYLEYKKACTIYKYDYNLINRLERLDVPLEKNSLVIFVNPSTPDGTLYDIEKLLDFWNKQGATVLIDESFLDFTEGVSSVKYIHRYERLYVLKSMTKFYSSAGIRVGTIISNKLNIDELKKFEPMWKLSSFDSAYLQEALKDKKFKKVARAINVKNKIYLEKILQNSNLVDYIFNSSANFVLARLKKYTAKQLQEELKKYKIMIRDCSNFDFLDEKFIRVAVKSQNNLDSLKKALDAISK
ncbi:aminotransferase class I/II-fold pyridoxal phosphate-dependent enzyme [Arcobacter sp. CECT 8985]|uniref:aminotransferase class I/II-fold pyridoxal phosphate-dependent enzyme n=1 Tax=Arcobacter sp. CECT 8985 TaxID=1935424 RepID=UPI00100A7DA1|nr:aminotransferase class I/II-fold pyridoxal phosphate-dependent enzyme [Arcobacter sp. CECT 8985]RXJ83523.1 aminotransferase class I/II [Arcobacter sp. CECT 8985]